MTYGNIARFDPTSKDMFHNVTGNNDSVEYEYAKVMGLIDTLSKIYKELSKDELTERWSDIKEDILSEYTLARLILTKEHFKNYIKSGDRISDATRLVLYCEREGIDCGNMLDNNRIFRPISFAGQYRSCLKADMLLGGNMDEVTSEGIENGLTLILWTGTNLLWKALNITIKDPQPGMHDFLSPDQGISGLRLIVLSDSDLYKLPYSDGIDIPSGVSALVGLTAKEIKHLPHPYTNCSNGISEISHLLEDIEKLGHLQEVKPADLSGYTHQTLMCR